MDDKRLVHLVDDETAILRSLAFLLRTSGYSVATWTSGEAFLKAVKPGEACCVLLDVRMPGLSGLQVQEELRERGLIVPVIILTGHGDVENAVAALKAGAVDYLEKPFERERLLSAIESGFASLETRAGQHLTAADAAARLAALTPREQEVLSLLAQGMMTKQIARMLDISPRTVEAHRAHITERLGVHGLTSALRIAFAAGMDSQHPLRPALVAKSGGEALGLRAANEPRPHALSA